MSVGTFIAKAVDPSKKLFTVPFNTLDEPMETVKEMAAKVFEFTTFILSKRYPGQDKPTSNEVTLDLPKGYYGYAISFSSKSGQNLILGIAVKSVSMALFAYAVDASRARIIAVVDRLKDDLPVRVGLIRDLHLTLEREFEIFKL
ncbi:MAG: hypothetical protein WED04_12665 [Promethearchaeati archaeon SRVP18_Atabeyarchaeia-1]